jgi:hypothetical protein
MESIHGEEVTDMVDSIGEIIDLSEQVTGSRGATAKYDDALTAFLSSAFKADKVARLSGDTYVVLRSNYSSEDEYKNAKQAVGAEIRKHARRVVEADEGLTGKASVQWHPETGQPQVSLKA